MIALASLFVVALLAATPLPLTSELVFLGLLATGWKAWLLVLVASAGNILGSCVTYGLGRWLGDRRDHRWFPLKPDQMTKAEGWFNRWGLWLLLLSWAPMGDVIVAMAGVLRVRVVLFLVLVALAKTGRYIALAWLGAAAFGA